MLEAGEHTLILRVARLVAWVAAIASLVQVCLHYDQLPEQLPLTRWRSAPKSWLIALRAPVINLLSLGLVEVLTTSLRRVPGFTRGQLVTAILLLVAGRKAVTLAYQLIHLPAELHALTIVTLAVAVSGVATAAFMTRDLLRAEQLRRLTWTKAESALTLTLGLALAALELPLITH
jgi:energy-converting hydrogenase Eha subunit A